METVQIERKAELQSEIQKIDSGIAAADNRLTLWRAKLEQAGHEIATLTARLQEIYALQASGQETVAPDAPEEDLAEARRLQAGATKLIADEEARLASLQAERQPLVVELEQLELAEAKAAESLKTDNKIERAQAAFAGLDVAAGEFLKSLQELKSGDYIDAANEHRASEVWFSLQSQVKGFNY